MTKSAKEKNSVYKSFEQFKAEVFPVTAHKQSTSPNQDISSLAVCLAETSFNKVLLHDTKP